MLLNLSALNVVLWTSFSDALKLTNSWHGINPVKHSACAGMDPALTIGNLADDVEESNAAKSSPDRKVSSCYAADMVFVSDCQFFTNYSAKHLNANMPFFLKKASLIVREVLLSLPLLAVVADNRSSQDTHTGCSALGASLLDSTTLHFEFLIRIAMKVSTYEVGAFRGFPLFPSPLAA
jgi:hypothetical protein